MKRKTNVRIIQVIGFILIFHVLLVSCGTTKSTIAFHEESTPANDSAQIYIYRLPSMVGAAGYWRVLLDNKVVANLMQNAYVVIHVSPGKHNLVIGDSPAPINGTGLVGDAVLNGIAKEMDSQSRLKGNFTAKKNTVYYFKSNGFKVSFVTRDEAIVDLVYMKYDKGL